MAALNSCRNTQSHMEVCTSAASSERLQGWQWKDGWREKGKEEGVKKLLASSSSSTGTASTSFLPFPLPCLHHTSPYSAYCVLLRLISRIKRDSSRHRHAFLPSFLSSRPPSLCRTLSLSVSFLCPVSHLPAPPPALLLLSYLASRCAAWRQRFGPLPEESEEKSQSRISLIHHKCRWLF